MAYDEVGFNPPIPKGPTSSSQQGIGQQLLGLVRQVETHKMEGDSAFSASNYDRDMDELVELLNCQTTLCARRGILQGDLEKANHVLESSTTINTSASGTSKKSRGANKRGKKDRGNDLSLQHQDGDGSEGSPSMQLQESLFLKGILRLMSLDIRSGRTVHDNYRAVVDDDRVLLITLSSNFCFALIQFIRPLANQNSLDSVTLFQGEYQLLAQYGKSLLSCCAQQLKNVDDDIQRHLVADKKASTQMAQNSLCMSLLSIEETCTGLITSCLKTSTAMILLFGTKLSRNTGILGDLRLSAWRFLTLPNNSVQSAAAQLLATLPHAGSTDGKTVSDLWNSMMLDVPVLLSKTVESVVPWSASKQRKQEYISDDCQQYLTMWCSFFQQANVTEKDKVQGFNALLSGLTRTLQALFLQDAFKSSSSSNAIVEAKLDVDQILDVVQIFVSFSVAAESVYNKTKKRLRSEVIDGNMISIQSVSSKMANNIKYLGHQILDTLLHAVGGPMLIPWARRIIRMTYASLLTSSSGIVRNVMDPAVATKFDAKKRKWLHLSISMRAVAVNSFRLAVLSFGNEKCETTGAAQSDGELATSLVVGCLLEQLKVDDSVTVDKESWVSVQERVEFVISCILCLKAVVESHAGFLPDPLRSLLDSVATFGLTGLRKTDQGSEPLSWAPVKVAFLEYSTSCLVTPWGDGSASSISDLLFRTSQLLSSDNGSDVAQAAKHALQVCHMNTTPRSPALMIKVRTETGVDSAVRDARDIFEDLQKEIHQREVTKLKEDQKRREKEVKKRELLLEQRESEMQKKAKIEDDSQNDATEQTVLSDAESARIQDQPPLAAEPAANLLQEVGTTQIEEYSNGINEVATNLGSKEEEDQENSSVVPIPDDDDDDDALPAIFDGGPDSDDNESE